MWYLPISDEVFPPPVSTSVTVVLHIWDATSRSHHDSEGFWVQGSCSIQPKKALHILQFGRERGTTPSPTGCRICLETVEVLQVFLQENVQEPPQWVSTIVFFHSLPVFNVHFCMPLGSRKKNSCIICICIFSLFYISSFIKMYVLWHAWSLANRT